MFLSHEKSPSKMKFQKPNILRKRSKIVDRTQSEITLNNIATKNCKADKKNMHKCSKPVLITRRPTQRIILEPHFTDVIATDSNTVGNLIDATVVKTLKSDAVLSATANKQLYSSIPLQDCLYNVTKIGIEDECETITSDSGNWLMNQVKRKNNNHLLPLNTLVVIEKESLSAPDIVKDGPAIELIILKYTCDVADCKKSFISEQSLKKHKAIHKKNVPKTTAQSYQCPAHLTVSAEQPGPQPLGSAEQPGSVSVGSADQPGSELLGLAEQPGSELLGSDAVGSVDEPVGSEEPARRRCARLFSSRRELLKHLKEDHTLEDAAYRCSGCARRFFHAGGERTHARACAAARRALVCPWGCGRQFLQPCRLREHARAHTGDRPYPCTHPNCGWSFRTASKLERHARRHRGERRHVCGACGRGFLRREHLREHAARHARDAAAAAAAEAAAAEAAAEAAAAAAEAAEAEAADADANDYASADTQAPEVAVLAPPAPPAPLPAPRAELPACAADTDWRMEEILSRAARTHCPWPLAHRAVPQVEMSEAESEVYTIRSDLFLHGNILHNEDSESCPAGGPAAAAAAAEAEAAEAAAEAEAAAAEAEAVAGVEALHDVGLGLFDAHSTIDFMQEELLYIESTDAQFEVDISAFYSQMGIRR